jgi:hypothetical protein
MDLKVSLLLLKVIAWEKGVDKAGNLGEANAQSGCGFRQPTRGK